MLAAALGARARSLAELTPNTVAPPLATELADCVEAQTPDEVRALFTATEGVSRAVCYTGDECAPLPLFPRLALWSPNVATSAHALAPPPKGLMPLMMAHH